MVTAMMRAIGRRLAPRNSLASSTDAPARAAGAVAGAADWATAAVLAVINEIAASAASLERITAPPFAKRPDDLCSREASTRYVLLKSAFENCAASVFAFSISHHVVDRRRP